MWKADVEATSVCQTNSNMVINNSSNISSKSSFITMIGKNSQWEYYQTFRLLELKFP